MGFLSSKKKKIFVASHTYNLAGDINDRPNFLKTTIVDQAIHKPHKGYGDALQHNLINGPGMQLRSFARWAERVDYYKEIGMTKQGTIVSGKIDLNLLNQALDNLAGQPTIIVTAEIGESDISYWVDDYLINNMEEDSDKPYSAELINPTTVVFHFVNEDGEPTSEDHTITISGYVEGKEYLYASYYTQTGIIHNPLVKGSQEEVEEFRDTDGWEQESREHSIKTYEYPESVVTVRHYPDGSEETLGDQTTVKEFKQNENITVFTRIIKLPVTEVYPDPRQRKELLHQINTHRLKKEVNVVEKEYENYKDIITTTTYTIHPIKEERVDSITSNLGSVSNTKYVRYMEGSGNPELDKVFHSREKGGLFYPIIPLKRDKRWIEGDLWALNEKAYRKATGAKSLNRLKDNINEGEGSGDIDFAFIIFGVSINTKEQSSKRYIYEFFDSIQGELINGQNSLDDFYALSKISEDRNKEWEEWYEAQKDTSNPLWGTEEPTLIPAPTLPATSLKLTGGATNWEVSWNFMVKDTVNGTPPDKIRDRDVWITKGNKHERELVTSVYVTDTDTGGKKRVYRKDFRNFSSIYINRLTGPNEWERIKVYGLNLYNHIYAGKTANLVAYDELSESDESGLIIPLNTEIYRQTPLIHGTQMTTACAYLVLNSYLVKKVKKRLGGIFKVLAVVVVIAIGVVSGGSGLAAGAGILGSNMAVGAAVGLTGIAAVVVGAVANAVAAIIVTNVITKASKELFGDAIGNIIGVVAAIVSVAYLSGSSLADSLSDVFSPKNLLKITESAANSIGEYGMMQAQGIMKDMEKFMANAAAEAKELNQIIDGFENTNTAFLDPMKYTQAIKEFHVEQPSVFFDRTLLTGMDIAGLSMDSISMFTDIAVSTNLRV